MLDFAETGAAHTGHEGVGALLYGGGVIPYFREKTAEGEEVFGLGGGFDAVVEYVAGKGEHIEAEGVGAEFPAKTSFAQLMLGNGLYFKRDN